jgi:hypothetical protein
VYNQGTVASDLTGYKIIFSNGKEVTAPATGVITIKTTPGKHTITVKGIGPKPAGYTDPTWPAEVVWARGTSGEVNLNAGKNDPVPVAMYPAAEPANWGQLTDAIAAGGGREEHIYINGTIYKLTTTTINIQRDITLKGSGEIRTNNVNGQLINIVTAGSLTIDGPTLRGHTANNAPLVNLTGGPLRLISGAITGNQYPSGQGGGVRIMSGQTFTMDGGTVSGNTATLCGGVYVQTSGIFNMNGGTIGPGNSSSGGGGGGVYVANTSVFTMTRGTITGNTGTSGGGVYVATAGTFTMTGGAIGPGNTASLGQGGGVFVVGTFNLNTPATTGNISGNIASTVGPQVRKDSGGTFNINTIPIGTDY